MGGRRLPRAVGVGAALLGASTAVVFALEGIVPVENGGIVYLPAVIVMAWRFGLRAGVVAGLLAMFLYNILFLPPRHTITIDDSRNWQLFAVTLICVTIVAQLAARERQRAAEALEREREAALLAGLASALVGGATLEAAQREAASLAAAAVGAAGGRIARGDGPAPEGVIALPLRVEGRTIGHLELQGAPAGVLLDPDALRVASSLAGVLALASEHEELAAAQIEAEALRRSDSLKTALLRAVSHELRSPLTAIKTGVSVLLESRGEVDPETEQQLLRDVSEQGDRLDRLIGDLLDLSRLQAGAASSTRDWCEVADLMRGALGASRGRIGSQEVRLVGTRDLPLVRVDGVQVERVLVNLIENAARVSPPGSAVEVRADDADGEVVIAVADRGPGIAPDERERVFAPFYRGAGSRAGGTGLGLAIARGFAEANGGRLEIADRPGGGAELKLMLPAVEALQPVG